MPGEQFQIYNFDIFRKIFISACTNLVLDFQYLNSKPSFIIPTVNIIFEIMLCACLAIYLYLEWVCFPSAAKIIRTKLSTISIIIVSVLNIDFHLSVKSIKFILIYFHKFSLCFLYVSSPSFNFNAIFTFHHFSSDVSIRIIYYKLRNSVRWAQWKLRHHYSIVHEQFEPHRRDDSSTWMKIYDLKVRGTHSFISTLLRDGGKP